METSISDWDAFVLRHTKRGNLILHFISCLVYWISLCLGFVTLDWRYFAVWAFSGTLGTAGHYLFDDGELTVQEAALNPLVPFYVTVMFYRMARGWYFDDLRIARDKYAARGAAEPHG